MHLRIDVDLVGMIAMAAELSLMIKADRSGLSMQAPLYVSLFFYALNLFGWKALWHYVVDISR